VFGAGEAFLVASALGNTPWTVLAEGVGMKAGIGVGAATVLISLLVLLSWVPLRQSPGLGTIANALLIGPALGIVLLLISKPHVLVWQGAFVLTGILLVGLGSGLYLGCRMGPGPRDGLMLGIHRRTNVSVRLARTTVEVLVVVAGVLLGGTAGVGTLVFALLVGPVVQRSLVLLHPGSAAEL
jgi:uncharacterized membrane protein YczE